MAHVRKKDTLFATSLSVALVARISIRQAEFTEYWNLLRFIRKTSGLSVFNACESAYRTRLACVDWIISFNRLNTASVRIGFCR
jgi:hypothetical protein